MLFSSKSHLVLRLLMLLVLAMIVSACGQLAGVLSSDDVVIAVEDTVKPADQDTTVILPLRLGIEWNYKYLVYDSAGNQTNGGVLTLKVVKDTVVEGERWYFFSDGASLFNDLGANRLDGYWSRKILVNTQNDSVVGFLDPYLSSKYPAEVGDTFSNDSDYVTLVIATDSIFDVTAGTFESYVYKKSSPTANIDSSFYVRSPGIGTIYREEYRDDANGTPYLWRVLELTGNSL